MMFLVPQGQCPQSDTLGLAAQIFSIVYSYQVGDITIYPVIQTRSEAYDSRNLSSHPPSSCLRSVHSSCLQVSAAVSSAWWVLTLQRPPCSWINALSSCLYWTLSGPSLGHSPVHSFFAVTLAPVKASQTMAKGRETAERRKRCRSGTAGSYFTLGL